MTIATHQNGLVLSSREDLSLKHTQNGFLIRPHNFRELRAPVEIAVSLITGQQPSGEWPNTRRIGKEIIYYRIDTEPGGSGGEVRILKAWKAVLDAHILVIQRVQAEGVTGEEFNIGWDMMAHTNRKGP